MGVKFNQYLNSNCIFGCRDCRTHLAVQEDIMSRNFIGRTGDAYLFNNVVNIDRGNKEERDMRTGRYTVQNLACAGCDGIIGWVYVKAHDKNESYKEGKFILEASALLVVQ